MVRHSNCHQSSKKLPTTAIHKLKNVSGFLSVIFWYVFSSVRFLGLVRWFRMLSISCTSPKSVPLRNSLPRTFSCTSSGLNSNPSPDQTRTFNLKSTQSVTTPPAASTTSPGPRRQESCVAQQSNRSNHWHSEPSPVVLPSRYLPPPPPRPLCRLTTSASPRARKPPCRLACLSDGVTNHANPVARRPRRSANSEGASARGGSRLAEQSDIS